MPKARSIAEQQEAAFNARYSRFKIVFYFRDGNKFTHYGLERINCTVHQINFRHITTLMLDAQLGLNDCLLRLDWFAGKYTTAMIYDRKGSTTLPDGTKLTGTCVRKYVNGILVEEATICLNDAKRYFTVIHSDQSWTLERIPTPNDFKNIVTSKLQNS